MADDTIRHEWSAPPEPGRPMQVADGIEWLRLPLPMALDHVNCWLLTEADGTVTVVDTGLDTRTTRDLWTQALNGRRVSRVLVTHFHPDHVGLAGWFRTEHDAELLTSRTAFLMTRMLCLDTQEEPTDEMVAFWRRAGMAPEVLTRRMAERPFNFSDVVTPLPLGFRRLAEEDMIEIGGRWWHVHAGDGHAPEHLTLWEEGGDLVIGGDQLLPSISPNLGVYATEPEADPVGDWLASCERFRDLARPEKLVLPGHNLPYRGLTTRLDQLIGNHVGALDRLERHLDRPRPAGACFAPLFKREIGDGEYGLALGESLAHCLHLVHMGRATRSTGEDGAWLFRAA